MKNKERFIRTAVHKEPGRGLLWPHSAWPETRERWLSEGMPADYEWGYDFPPGEGTLNIDIGYRPPWDTGVIEQDDTYFIARDEYGIIRKYPKSGREGIAQFIAFPAAGRDDWKKLEPRLAPGAQGRFPDNWPVQAARLSLADVVVTFGNSHLCGFYSFIREVMGDEEALYLLYDDPGLVREMLEFQVCRLSTLLQCASRDITVDRLFIWEDMCYKNGPLISPEMFREFLMTPYQRLIECARDCGVRVVDLDSDGNVEKLIPLWIEAGGYIPAADHSIPPDVSFDNFKFYLDCLADLVGR